MNPCNLTLLLLPLLVCSFHFFSSISLSLSLSITHTLSFIFNPFFLLPKHLIYYFVVMWDEQCPEDVIMADISAQSRNTSQESATSAPKILPLAAPLKQVLHFTTFTTPPHITHSPLQTVCAGVYLTMHAKSSNSVLCCSLCSSLCLSV